MKSLEFSTPRIEGDKGGVPSLSTLLLHTFLVGMEMVRLKESVRVVSQEGEIVLL